jgi:HEAT repeat protein
MAAFGAAPPQRSVAGLVRQLRAGDLLARQDAAEALGRLGPGAEPAIPALRAALKDPWVRPMAALALASTGPKALSVLMAELKQEKWTYGLRQDVTTALARIGPAAVPTLAGAIDDQREAVRDAAAIALGEMGPAAAPAVPALIVSLAMSPVPSLARIESKPLRIAGLGELEIPTFSVQLDAPGYDTAHSLGKIGGPALPALISLVQMEHRGLSPPALRSLVRSALRLPGPRVKSVRDVHNLVADSVWLVLQTPTLGQYVRAPSPAARELAVMAIGEMGRAGHPAIPQLTRFLRDRDERVRLEAIEVLGKFGAAARPAVPALTAVLKERPRPNPGKRNLLLPVPLAAAWALHDIGGPGREALRKHGLTVLVETLKDDAAVVERSAATLLREIGPDAAAARAALLKLLKAKQAPDYFKWSRVARAVGVPVTDVVPFLDSGDVEVRRIGAEALSYFGGDNRRVAARLVRALEEEDPLARVDAALALTRIGAHLDKALPILIRSIADEGPRDKEASRALVRLGADARRAVRPLRRALAGKKPPHTRVLLAYTLVGLGAPARELFAELVACLNHKDSDVASDAWVALLSLGAKARPAAPLLRKLIEDPEADGWLYAIRVLSRLRGKEARLLLPVARREMRRMTWSVRTVIAVQAIRTLGPDGAEAVPELLAGLARLPRWNEEICRALGRVGPAARPAVGALRKELVTEFAWRDAAEALGRIGPAAADAVPDLTAMLKLTDEEHRGHAAAALGAIGPAARRAVPRLKAALADRSPAVRAWSAYALARITGEKDPYVSILAGLLATTEEASQALGRLGPDARAALPQLRAAVREGAVPIRKAAIDCLGSLGPLAREAVPELIRRLDDPYYLPRRGAATALGKIGPAAQSAVPRLRALVEAEDDAAHAAREALKQILTGGRTKR